MATLTTAGALALTPVTVTPDAPTISAARISTQAVQLTDAWSDLLAHTLDSVVATGKIYLGLDTGVPLPNPIFFAPIAAQLVINSLIYTVELFRGQGAMIPTQINQHLAGIANVVNIVFPTLPQVIVQQIQTPFKAAQLTLESIATAANKLIALIEAPAVFLDFVLNSEFGLLSPGGPIGYPLIFRNLLATALDTAAPLPFKKPAAAASTAKTAAATAPSGTASSARSKSTTPVIGSRKASTKASKAPSAKSTAKSGTGGQGRSARG